MEMNIDDCHKVLLDIAKDIHRVCVENGIPYYMLGGTMLGAIRHKGFIPWDDDMDLGIPRRYFKKFEEVYTRECRSIYKVNNVDNSKHIGINFLKISDTRTLIKEQTKEDIKEEMGLNVDIFPLDRTDGRKDRFTSLNWWIIFSMKIFYYKTFSIRRAAFKRKVVAVLVRLLLPFRKRTIISFIEKHFILPIKADSHMVNFYGEYKLKEIIDARYFGTPRLYPFEDTEFYGVELPDPYLKCLYGNYMWIPPEDQRHLHHVEMRWK